MVICNGDAEVNPGPMLHSCHSFSICHWNVKSLSAYNFIKVYLLQAYITISKFDIICLSETSLDSSVLSKDANLGLTGYNLVRAEHPSNTKKDDAGVYFKEYLPLKLLNIQYLQECINFEIIIRRQKMQFHFLLV